MLHLKQLLVNFKDRNILLFLSLNFCSIGMYFLSIFFFHQIDRSKLDVNEYWYGVFSFCLTIMLLMFSAVVFFRFLWIKKSRIRSLCINFSLLYFTVLYMIIVLEIVFRLFFIETSLSLYSLSNNLWFQKHWNPVNTLGYRDYEHKVTDENIGMAAKKKIFVVGDSFVAGYGIRNYRDRFSDLLAAKLGDNWEIYNIAKVGWDTEEEYKAIINYKQKPDIIILSYIAEDILDSSAKTAMLKEMNDAARLAPSLLRDLLKYSFFINYLYLKIIKFNSGYNKFEEFAKKYLAEYWRDEKKQRIHFRQLMNIVKYSRENNIRLITVVFPHLRNIEFTKKYTSKVVDFMKENNVEILDLGEILNGWKVSDLVVNAGDPHPSVKLNHEIGRLLFLEISDIKIAENSK